MGGHLKSEQPLEVIFLLCYGTLGDDLHIILKLVRDAIDIQNNMKVIRCKRELLNITFTFLTLQLRYIIERFTNRSPNKSYFISEPYSSCIPRGSNYRKRHFLCCTRKFRCISKFRQKHGRLLVNTFIHLITRQGGVAKNDFAPHTARAPLRSVCSSVSRALMVRGTLGFRNSNDISCFLLSRL